MALDRHILAFDSDLPAGADAVQLLGGKAAGLAVMSRELGLPVPPGFVVTTEACRQFRASGWDVTWEDAIREQLEQLGARTRRQFGDARQPLLVSVRSGAPVSMPGMMDTLLNVGMTTAIRRRLADESGSEHFAADTWVRFNRMYAEIVLGVPKDRVAEAAHHRGSALSILDAAARIREVAAPLGGIPEDPFEQLTGAIKAVFRSWDSERARVFRAKEGIADGLGTAATVQAMVFGNLDEDSGTGVAFTRDPATGIFEPVCDYLARAQGEDVVAGDHHVGGLETLREHLPAVHDELLAVMSRLEHHYRDMCDIEFTVSAGRLYLLQTRVGRRSPLAAVRIAVQMANDPEFPLTEAEAVARVGESTLREIATLGEVEAGMAPLARGLAVSPGVAAGVLCCNANSVDAMAKGGQNVILARPETSPEDVHGMVASAGLVTTLGGMVSHAAVVARSWAIPAVCSLAEAEVLPGGIRVGTQFLPEGTLVTVDGTNGALYEGDCRREGSGDIPELQALREWSARGDTAGKAGGSSRLVGAFEAMRIIQLKGLCSFARVAEALGVTEAAVAAALQPQMGMLKETPRGFALLPEGRAFMYQQVATERGQVDAAALEEAWGRFLPFNTRFKALVTEAQQTQSLETASPGWPAVVEQLRTLHEGFSPVVDAVATAAPRLASYRPRFEAAMAAVADGEPGMVASPLKDSYHTVWFEFHEELIALTGRDRAKEEAAGH